MIDEPEVSLHPQLQSFLLNEILKVAGANNEKGKKLVFISTHSTEFIELHSVFQLASIIFCKDILESPIQIDPSIREFQGKKLQALLSRMGQEHKLALFSHRPLLVEGPSDQIICTSLSRKLSLNTEAAGCQILPVTGKGQFPVVFKLMRLIGKHPVILADADALTDGIDVISSFTQLTEAIKIASEMGHRDASKFAKDIHNDFCAIVNDKWEDLKEFAEKHYYWKNRDSNKDELIAKRRSAFCWLLNTENSNISTINNSSEWLLIKARLTSLLDFLEKVGCFILRKGTVESYYKYSDFLTNDEKPNAASYEATQIIEESKESILSHYADLIRAIKYCSSAKEINEAEAIRNMLLAIVSPALAFIKRETTNSELKVFSNSLFGAKANLFHLSVEVNNDNIYLNIDLTSQILEVSGFPMKIAKGANPIEVVNSSLMLK